MNALSAQLTDLAARPKAEDEQAEHAEQAEQDAAGAVDWTRYVLD